MTDALVETLEDLVARRPAKYRHESYVHWEGAIAQFILDLREDMQASAARLVANHLKAQEPAMPLEILWAIVMQMLRTRGCDDTAISRLTLDMLNQGRHVEQVATMQKAVRR